MRPFSAASAGSYGRARPHRRSGRDDARLRGRVELRVLQNRPQLGNVAHRRGEVIQLLRDLRQAAFLLRGLEQGAARRCGEPQLSDRLLLFERREVEVADRVLDQPLWSSSSSTLPVTFAVAIEGELGDLGADLLDRAVRLRLDLPLRLLEPPLAVGLGLLLDALALDSATLRASARISSASAARLADQGVVLLEQLARLARARSASSIAGGSAHAARRSSSGSARTRTASARRA